MNLSEKILTIFCSRRTHATTPGRYRPPLSISYRRRPSIRYNWSEDDRRYISLDDTGASLLVAFEIKNVIRMRKAPH